MLNRIKNTIYYTVAIVFLCACEPKDVYYDIPEASNILVVNCFFNPDSIWKASISKLGNILALDSNNSSLYVSNAQVVLYEENIFIDTLKFFGNGQYISNKGLRPECNKRYKIQVTCNGFKDIVSDFEELPKPVIIDSITYLDYLPSGIFSNEVYTMQENQQTEYHSIYVTLDQSHKGQYFKAFLSDNSLLSKEGLSLSSRSKKDFIEYYSWECSMLESTKSGELSLQLPLIPEFNQYLSVYTVSESYLLYELSYAEYDFVINTTYLLTPNNIYSNIQGGVGIFTGYTSNIINLQEYN